MGRLGEIWLVEFLKKYGDVFSNQNGDLNHEN